MGNSENYKWTDNPTEANVSVCDPDILNECLMYLRNESVSKMYETGAVSEDVKGFEELLKRAHSSFDLSKFEVVGSPTITEDGIASGFSSSNFIRATYIPLGQNFKIYLPKFNTSDINTTQTFFKYSDNNIRAQIFNGKIRLFRYTSASAYDLPVGKTSLTNNQDYYYYIEQTNDNDTYNFKGYISTDGNNWSLDIDLNSVNPIYDAQTSNPIEIGGGTGVSPILGTIDLKQFSNIVVGIPVFNGNKTGLEIIKPDNYEVVGSPTITDDGVLTNCPSQGDYLSATIPSLAQFQKVRIELVLRIKEVPSSTRGIFNIPNDENPLTANAGTYAWLSSNGFNLNLAYNSSSDSGTCSNSNCPVAVGDFIKVVAEGYKNSVGSIKVSKNNQAFSELPLTFANVCNFQEATKLFLGISGTGRQMQNVVEFDLNSFKIYGDDNLVYQPCLKIPYTEAFKHSRIVNVAYRHRVQDLAEQKGEALFYTIDEQNQNFTLPSADIYGMITKNREIAEHADLATAKAYIVETYKNGASWYRIWSDGWIEQGGITSQTNTTINFLKSFSNTNYIFTATKRNPITGSWAPEKGPIGTSGATVSSIITASYTDNYPISWCACGY